MSEQLHFKANVSELHLCRRCPRLLAFQLSGSKNAWQTGLKSESFCGKVFHEKIAAPFHNDASGRNGTEKRREILDLIITKAHDRNALKKAFLDRIYRNCLYPFLVAKSRSLDTSQIEALGQCIVKWSDFFVEFFCGNSGFLADPKTFAEHVFLPPEKLMKANYADPDGKVLAVRGRFDCALLDRTRGEVLLVEFKCLKETDPTEELAQLALYAWLVRESTGLTPRTYVLYLDEEKPTVTFSAAETDNVIALLPRLFDNAIRVIQAVDSGNADKGTIPKADRLRLCEECFYAKECDSRFGKIVTPSFVGSSGENSEAEEYLRRLVDYLGKYKLAVKPDGYTAGPRFIRLRIIPFAEKGVTVAKIQKRANDMQIGLELAHPPLIQTQSGHVSVDVPCKNVKPLMLLPLIRSGETTRPSSGVAVPLGAEIDGKTFWLDFADPTMSSVLIGGTSGSGKSVLLQSLVLGLCLANPDMRTEFTLIDPKRVSFTKFPLEKIDAELIYDPQPALDRLSLLVGEMEQRYHLFESEKCSDITTYNAVNPRTRLWHHVTVVDEFADLMIDKKANKDLEIAIQRLGQKGRAAGFHLVLATQRPEAKVISPLIKANLQVKIAMKVTSQANSKIILDEIGAECLIGNGDMLLGGNVKLTRLQGAMASKTDYDTLVPRQTRNK